MTCIHENIYMLFRTKEGTKEAEAYGAQCGKCKDHILFDELWTTGGIPDSANLQVFVWKTSGAMARVTELEEANAELRNRLTVLTLKIERMYATTPCK